MSDLHAGNDYGFWMGLPANACASNARFLKAAVMAGFYPSVLRIQHPKPVYKQVGMQRAAARRPSTRVHSSFIACLLHPG